MPQKTMYFPERLFSIPNDLKPELISAGLMLSTDTVITSRIVRVALQRYYDYLRDIKERIRPNDEPKEVVAAPTATPQSSEVSSGAEAQAQ